MQILNVLLAAGLASAATIRIDSGMNGMLMFSPETVTAAKGDILEFHFLPINHSVARGEFDTPCQPAKTNGFFSGYVPVMSGESEMVFRVTVNDTKPIWFYCTQNFHSHCQGGMVGVVNPPKNQTVAQYKTASMATKMSSDPAASAFGGLLEKGSAASGGSGSSSSSGGGMSGGMSGGMGGGNSSSGGGMPPKKSSATGLQTVMTSVFGVMGLALLAML